LQSLRGEMDKLFERFAGGFALPSLRGFFAEVPRLAGAAVGFPTARGFWNWRRRKALAVAEIFSAHPLDGRFSQNYLGDRRGPKGSAKDAAE
jgi:hypothetical protein